MSPGVEIVPAVVKTENASVVASRAGEIATKFGLGKVSDQASVSRVR